MTAEVFLTDCEVSCIFRKLCEVEHVSGNESPESVFRSWARWEGRGVSAPVHGGGVGGGVPRMHIHFGKKEPSQVCFHIVMVHFGSVWCIDTTACGCKTSLLNSESTLPVFPPALSTRSHHISHDEIAHRLLVTLNTKHLCSLLKEYNRCLMSRVK